MRTLYYIVIEVLIKKEKRDTHLTVAFSIEQPDLLRQHNGCPNTFKKFLKQSSVLHKSREHIFATRLKDISLRSTYIIQVITNDVV